MEIFNVKISYNSHIQDDLYVFICLHLFLEHHAQKKYIEMKSVVY